jgi:hypothetical protein
MYALALEPPEAIKIVQTVRAARVLLPVVPSEAL